MQITRDQVLCALLAVLTVGVGVQAYSIMELREQLGQLDGERAVHTADATTAAPLDVTPTRPATPDTDPLAAAPPPMPVDPYDDFARMDAHMDRLFDGFMQRFDTRGAGPAFLDPDTLFGRASAFGPRLDFQDRGDHYEVLVDIPGTNEAELKVEADDERLVIEGSRSTETEAQEPGSFVRRERHVGHFKRQLWMPSDADPALLDTEYDDGVLRIRVGKRG